jgi:nucleoside-diphosphate-sugar epimerase
MSANTPPMSVVVTGASGFVGQMLIRALRRQGLRVRAVARRVGDGEGPENGPAMETVRIENVGPGTDWTLALAHCSVVVHLAAHVHKKAQGIGDAADDFHRVNVEGSETLARQAARAGVRRFVFLSSVKVNGEYSMGRALTEQDPVVPVDAYGKSKAEAERRLCRVAADTGMEVVILRSPLVYGPGVKANFLNLLRAVDAGIPLPFASVQNRRSLIFVGNLVNAIETCLHHPAAANRTFFVSDGNDVSTAQLVTEVAVALGRKSRLWACPTSWLRLAGRLSGHTEQIARLTESLQIDISKIRAELGWRAPFTLRQGLAETAAWYRSRSD